MGCDSLAVLMGKPPLFCLISAPKQKSSDAGQDNNTCRERRSAKGNRDMLPVSENVTVFVFVQKGEKKCKLGLLRS